MVYRFDYLRLSSEGKPEPVVDGSSLYEVDTQKLYLYYKGTWYLQAKEENNEENNGLPSMGDDSSPIG